MSASSDRWWETTPLEQMTPSQWESLCDGCGKCCLVKLWQANRVRYTKIACQLMDINTARCCDYENRTEKVKNCYKLSIDTLDTPGLLPETCAYKLIRDGKPLYDWHHLISGDRNTIVEAGMSIIGFAEATANETSTSRMHAYISDVIE